MDRVLKRQRRAWRDHEIGRRTAAAIHEAGHVVIGHYLGMTFDSAEVCSLVKSKETGCDGMTFRIAEQASPLDSATYAFAGMAAEVLFTNLDSDLINGGAKQDMGQLFAEVPSLRDMSPDDRERLGFDALKRASGLIERHEDAFGRLFSALMQGPLTGEEIVRIIEQPADPNDNARATRRLTGRLKWKRVEPAQRSEPSPSRFAEQLKPSA